MKRYAIGMLALGFSLLSAGAAWAAPAVTEIVAMEEKLQLEASGSAKVEVKVKFGKAEAGTLLIPTRFKGVEGLKVEGLAGATVAFVDRGGIRAFALTAPTAPLDTEPVKVLFSVPGFYDWKKEKVADFGNRGLEYKFMNNLPTKVQAYAMEVMLPSGYIVNTVDDSTPKLTSKTPVPPFKILRNANQYGISIKSTNLGIGDTCSVKIRFKESQKSTVFLVACLALCALYLVGFRDLLKPNGAAPAKA